MSSKITSEHLCRGAVVYIRQSSRAQVLENTESQRRQYELVDTARDAGFASVSVIDDDLGRSGSDSPLCRAAHVTHCQHEFFRQTA